MAVSDGLQAAHVRASGRQTGHHAQARHNGVHHSHGTPSGHPATRKTPPAHAARHHHATARASHPLTDRGTVSSYDAGANTAMVQLVGTVNRVIGPIPVSLGVPTGSLAGKSCLVSLLDAHNVNDAVLVAAW